MKPLVPSNPGPPKDPKSFWAPWPAIREPCAKRTINGADSFTLDPLDLAVFIFAPSVALLWPRQFRAAMRRGAPHTHKMYTRDGLATFPTSSCPYSPGGRAKTLDRSLCTTG